MIRKLKTSEIPKLNNFPPKDWAFDYEAFLRDFLKEDYFYAFVMIQDEEIIGTGNVLLKGKIGWLANIIIGEEYRGRGLGFEMTKFLVDFLKSKGCETQLLIATELGEPVYQKAGFRKVTDYQCFDSEIDQNIHPVDSIRKLEDSDIKEVCRLDQNANDEDRRHLIKRYYKAGRGYFNPENELLGFYLPNFGRGLVISIDKEAGLELLKLKHSEKGRRTLLPIDNQDGTDFLEKNGFRKGHSCSRMILGKEQKWNPQHVYSYASGYCG